MQQPKIKISQHNAPPDEKCVYFKLNNYFSELRTEVDKARARSNLGILSEYANTWENIIGKPDISSLLDTLKQQIVSTYNLGNLAGSLQDIRSRILQLETKTEGIDQNTITDVNKLWSDVARNSRDILALQSGGDTSLITRVASLEEQMANIGGTSATINNIITRLTALENNSGSQTDLTEVWSAIHALQSAIASDQIESISLSQQTLNVDVNAGNQSIIVYAKHSRLTELENVTAQCTCNTSDLRVAYWNNEEDKVVIVGTGRCVLTFSYAGLTATLSVEVTENGSQPIGNDIFLIGYATSLNEILSDEKYRKTQLNSIAWNSTNIPKQNESIEGNSVNLYIAIPQKYSTLNVTVGGLPVTMDQMSSRPTLNSVTYIPYKISQITSYDIEFNINVN